MQMQTKPVTIGAFTGPASKRAAVAPTRKSATTAASSSQNGAKPIESPRTAKEVSAQLDKLLEAAISASGCNTEAEFNKLPREERNAFLAQASGTAKTKGAVAGVQMLDPKTIRRSPFNREIDESDPDFIEICEHVAMHGVLQNGVVRTASEPRAPGILWEIIAGEGRWEAARRAGQLFPAAVRECSDTEALELQAAENMKRRNLNPIDEAIKYEQLRVAYEKEGANKAQALEKIQEKTGKAAATIYERLTLIKLPPATQGLVRKGKLPASHAGLLTKINDPRTIEQLAKTIVGDGPGALSFRETVQLVDGAVKREKNFAKWQSKRTEFEKNGWPVLTDAENEKVLGSRESGENWWIKSGGAHVKPSDHCELPGANWRPYEVLWKTPPTPILGRLADGRPVIIYRCAEAAQAVIAGGKLRKEKGSGGSTASAAEREKTREHKRRCAEFVATVGGVVQSIETTLDSAQFWRFFAAMLFRQWRSDPIRRVAARRDWKRGSGDALIMEKIATMGVGELRALCAEVLLYHDAPSSHADKWGKSIEAACSLCKLPLPAWSESQASGKGKK